MPTRPTVAILGEFGTYSELQQACERVGAQAFVTTDLNSLRDADGMVIAGHKKSLETYEAVRNSTVIGCLAGALQAVVLSLLRGLVLGCCLKLSEP